MTRINLKDQATIKQLLQLRGSVELCDEQGNLVGFFRPMKPTFDLSGENGLSEEEVQRRLKQPGRPLTEILHDLEKLK